MPVGGGGGTCYGMGIHFVWAKCEEGSNVGWVRGCARVGVCGCVHVWVYVGGWVCMCMPFHICTVHTRTCVPMCTNVRTYIRGALCQG